MGLGALVWVLLAGCGNGSATKTTENGGEATVTTAIVFDSGGRGDKSFNDSAWRGMQKAESDLGAQALPYDSDSERDYEANLTAAADEGVDLVIAVGINMVAALEAVAKEYPDTKFAIVDGNVDLPNVRSLVFAEEEGSYLVGYLAGLKTKTGKLGFVGGMNIPLIEKFQAGFTAGATLAHPGVEVTAKHTGSWDNIDTAKQSANILYSGGADIIFHAAGRAGLGVIRAAKEREMLAIGVDSNQDYIEPGYVLTSMIKRVDEAVFQTISDVNDGAFSAGLKSYDLSSNGVGVSELEFTKQLFTDEELAGLEDVKQKIIDGEISVPTTL
jgi:basic membrane protein A